MSLNSEIVKNKNIVLLREEKNKSKQHPVFPGGHPSKYWLGSVLLHFHENWSLQHDMAIGKGTWRFAKSAPSPTRIYLVSGNVPLWNIFYCPINEYLHQMSFYGISILGCLIIEHLIMSHFEVSFIVPSMSIYIKCPYMEYHSLAVSSWHI